MVGNGSKDKKGFSGLSDLASEIGGVDDQASSDPTAGMKPPPLPTATPSTPKDAHPREPHREPTTSPAAIETVNSGKGGESSGAKWVLGIIAAAVVFVIWLANNSEQSTKKPSYEPPATSQSYNYPQSSPAPAARTPSTLQSREVQYEKPPGGTNNVLSVPQICWCISEDIRIEAMRDVANTDAGVEEFNRIVNDFNSRCGSYRYREGSLERAKRIVEAHRSEIMAEAIRDARQFGRPSKPSSIPMSPDKLRTLSPKRPNSQDTREAQELLTDLGYKVGTIDGDYGPITSDAVKAFQRDMGLTQNGWIDQNLLDLLRNAKATYKPVANTPSIMQPSPDDPNARPLTPAQTSSVWTPPVTTLTPARADSTGSSNPKTLSFEDQSKYDTAIRLKRLGYDVDWRTSTLSVMLDAESRIGTANRLKRIGYDVDWQTSALSEMLDAESRIGTANRLKRIGYDVDWQTSALSEMLDAESRIGTANRLKSKGRIVDWREYSLSQLLAMESEAIR